MQLHSILAILAETYPEAVTGRQVCTARNAFCGNCPLINLCPRRGINDEHRPG